MNFDIPITLKVNADNELEAEKLVKDILDEVVDVENKVISWEFIEFVGTLDIDQFKNVISS
jgi:hypothetical protein